MLFGHDEPLSKGTLVLVKSAGDAFFEAKSKIIYEQPNMARRGF